ncbi:hypothetical protein PENSPDRAFT_618818 [Peniophora sp. CONT]|nr:hypothetical protein PENSPDRAFT_618818 [Peniophora sp. CONT]
MASTSALKVTPANTPARITSTKSAEAPPTDSSAKGAANLKGVTNPADISSPHELTAFVENILGDLDEKFDNMSSQLLERMRQMSDRVDALEASIQDIINGDGTVLPNSTPSSPGIAQTNSMGSFTALQPRRMGSGL